MTLFKFLSASARARIVSSDILVLSFLAVFSVGMKYSDSFVLLGRKTNLLFKCVGEEIIDIKIFELTLGSLKKCLKYIFIDFDLFDLLARRGGKESFCDFKSNLAKECYKCIEGSFLVDNERILLSVSFESDLFSEVCHRIDVLHPKFIDGLESQTSFKIREILGLSARTD